MNIAFLDATPHWSGGAQRLFLICRELMKLGHEVRVICLPGTLFEIRSRNAGIPVHPIHPFSHMDILSLAKILRLLRKEKIRAIDVHSPRFYWLGLVSGKILGIKVILTRNVPFRKKGLRKSFNRLLYRSADTVIAISEHIRDNLLDDYGTGLRVEIVHDGIDFSEFSNVDAERTRKNAREKYQIADRIALAIIGRIDKNKGHSIAIQAILSLKRQGHNVCLLIVGTGDRRIENNLRKTVRDLNLENEVIFTGFYDNVSEIIPAADIILTPSLAEGLGMSILESLALGKPVIASNVGGIPEIIRDGWNGLLVPPGDPQALAVAVGKMMKTGPGSFSENALDSVKDRFSIESTVSKYVQLFSTVV